MKMHFLFPHLSSQTLPPLYCTHGSWLKHPKFIGVSVETKKCSQTFPSYLPPSTPAQPLPELPFTQDCPHTQCSP